MSSNMPLIASNMRAVNSSPLPVVMTHDVGRSSATMRVRLAASSALSFCQSPSVIRDSRSTCLTNRTSPAWASASRRTALAGRASHRSRSRCTWPRWSALPLGGKGFELLAGAGRVLLAGAGGLILLDRRQILMIWYHGVAETEYGKVVTVSRLWPCYEKQISDFGFLLRRTI